ncbi:hypothetical protein [Chryseobacterium polytrichastri]|uniref:Uncharacterized protein n=1 Tax=Chryseobacterium polytrichastri TaxID=1302687 RepID=A0A1M6VHF8_9FLAO|nr:hypothetical protein [Chryseobacterium polytrichastri]SHK80942.1 hypothetical protein SAMN05444267_100833 [Chryseobacterium polytrichastri]
MTVEEIIELAEKEKKLTVSEIDSKLTELRSLNCRILECIIYVRVNQNCSLSDAKESVLKSTAWIDKRDEFINHQHEQMQEFLEAAKNDITQIEQSLSINKTEMKITLKKE